jgi:hypothetical protein
MRAVTEKQRFIATGWKAVADALARIGPEDAAEVKALVDAVLAAEKDERVTAGGVSDRTATRVPVDLAPPHSITSSARTKRVCHKEPVSAQRLPAGLLHTAWRGTRRLPLPRRE